MSIKDTLLESLPQAAILAMAGLTGGAPAASAASEGMQAARLRSQEMQRQAMLDARAAELHQAQLANLNADNARLDQQQELQKLQQAIALMERATQQQAETATDPAAAEGALMAQAQSAASLFGLAPDRLTGLVPNMAPMISNRKKVKAKEIYERAEKTYGPEAMANDAITLQTGELFGDLKPSQLRALFEAPAVTQSGDPARPFVPPTRTTGTEAERAESLLSEIAAAEAAGDTATAETLKAQYRRLLQAKRDLGQADDRPLQNTAAARSDRRVDTLAKGFDTQPAVRRAQLAAEAVTFANSLSPDTNNPADDQALIYAFAKAMDPESVVREGEYATVQKYAQSWADTFGFNAQRIFSNTAFLTPQARANMKATIQAKFEATRGAYDNIRKSYAQRINDITGATDGDSYLIDYGGSFPQAAPADQGANPNQAIEDALRSQGIQGRVIAVRPKAQ